jgi:integrase
MAIRKRTGTTKKGTQTAWLADYKDADSQRHRKSFPTQREAKQWLARTTVEVQEGTHTPDSATVTVSEAAQLWLKRARREGLEKSTILQYGQHARLHICPEEGGFLVDGKPFAGVKLSRLTKPMVENFRDFLVDHNSRETARKILTSFKSILNEAKRKGLVARNIAEDVTIEEDQRRKLKLAVGRDFPTRGEIQRLMGSAADPFRPFLVTATFCGLRASELRGLIWDDVLFAKRVIRVRQRADLWGGIDAPKSHGSQREVPMTDMVVCTLTAWKEVCPRKDGKLWLVFPNGVGNVENHPNIQQRGFDPTQIKAGVIGPVIGKNGSPVIGEDGEPVVGPKYSLHALRHFFASVIIEQGFSPKRVQELMGHANIKITFDTYGHLFGWSKDDHAKLAAGEAWVMDDAAE